ncbi:MAG: hypothetical protein ACYDC1_19150, partial [Limisphaerales bacterium]
TLLRRPQARTLAQQFYRDSLAGSSTRHRVWAGGHYALGATQRPGRFWRERAAAATSLDVAPSRAEATVLPEAPLQLAPGVEIVELPCVVDRFIETRPAVRHSSLAAPVAYLGEVELAPLLGCVRSGMTSRDLVQSWMPRVSPRNGPTIARWLIARGLLVSSADAPVTREGGGA